MNKDTELDELHAFRSDTPPMSAQAHFRGHQRLLTEIADRPTPRRGLRLRKRRALVASGVVLALAAGIVSTQIAGPNGADTPASAAEVLNKAADALNVAPTVTPRPDQFQFIDVVQVTSDPNDKERTRQWMSVTGEKPSQIQSTGRYDHTATIPPAQYHPGDTLLGAPYDVIAKLPTDPDKLLQVLAKDPQVVRDEAGKHTSPNVAIWGLMRFIVVAAPNAQQAAIFRAAATLPHMTYSADATDADGRQGEAVGLEVPQLGFVQFIFDKATHKFLGERTLGDPTGARGVEFNNAVKTVTFVDRVGQLP